MRARSSRMWSSSRLLAPLRCGAREATGGGREALSLASSGVQQAGLCQVGTMDSTGCQPSTTSSGKAVWLPSKHQQAGTAQQGVAPTTAQSQRSRPTAGRGGMARWRAGCPAPHARRNNANRTRPGCPTCRGAACRSASRHKGSAPARQRMGEVSHPGLQQVRRVMSASSPSSGGWLAEACS